jgi:hydrogenase maturation protease
MKRSKTAVIGLGNALLADEGAGIHAIRLLEKKLKDKKIDLIEGGTPGMGLLHQFQEREKIIFIDSGNCGSNLVPGKFVRFEPDQVISRKQIKEFSLHDFDLIQFLQFAKKSNSSEGVNVVIYCIQVAEVKMSETLSPILKKSLPFLVEQVYNELVVY